MTKLFAMAIPILAGKTEQWKKFSLELKTKYRKEFYASRKALGVQERTFFQSTPMGDMIIVTLQGEDPQGAFQKFGEKTDEFTKWFASQAKEIHGIDLTQKPSGKLPELVIETEAIEEPVHLLK
ncbi:MAG: hypothetical protein Q7W13_08175 [Bacteroidia bacterium]|nr:hypothetical protein [Bacteroidia bacterium]